MAEHHIQMDRDELPGEATIGTSGLTGTYAKDVTIAWDTTTVTTKALLIDTLTKVKNFIQNDIERNAAVSSNRIGYYFTGVGGKTGIGSTEGYTGFHDGSSGIATGSGVDITVEGGFTQGFKKSQILDTIEKLEDAIAQMDFPVA